jgi:HSP20 family protein
MTTVMEPLAPWLRDLNRLFTSQPGVPTTFVPPADVIVDEQGVTVQMDVPGVRPDKLEIELENDVLTVRGERTFPYATDEGDRAVRRVERGFGRFERSLRVPRGLDPESVEASLADGVLTLRIPRPESPQPHRVEIRHDTREQPVESVREQRGEQAEESKGGERAGSAST